VIKDRAPDYTFVSDYGATVYAQVDAIFEFRAGRPSDFSLCEPVEDMALMLTYVKRKRQIAQVEAQIAERKARAQKQKNRFGRK